jgi:structure-specific endonuclease subunit SLX1
VTALCPSSCCVAVSHLTCLSQDFLKESSGTTEIIPRGGHCKSCHNYILWGDVVRGCYRRLPPAEGDEHPDVATDDMFLSDEGDQGLENFPPKKRKSSVRSRSIKPRFNSRRKGNERDIASQSSEGELFDFTNIVSSSDSVETPVKRKPGRPRKHTLSPQNLSPISERQILPRSPNVASRKRREKDAAETLAFVGKDSVDVIDITSGSEDGRFMFADMFRTPSKGKGKEKQVAPTSSEGEIFDLDNLSSSSDGEDIGSNKRQPGRTQKLKAPLTAVQVRSTNRQRSPNPSFTSSSSAGDIGSAKRRPERPRKRDLKSPNALTPPPSSNEGNSSAKRRVGRPRQLDTQSIKLGSTGIEDIGTVKRQPGRPRKLDFPSPTTRRRPAVLLTGSPNSVIHPLSPKPPTLLEVQVSSSPESDNQATLKRRPGRPRKDPSTGTRPPSSSRKTQKSFQEHGAPFLSRPYHPPNLSNRGASESTAYKSDRHSYECPKFREYDLEHAMLNLTLTAPKVVLSSGNVLSD